MLLETQDNNYLVADTLNCVLFVHEQQPQIKQRLLQRYIYFIYILAERTVARMGNLETAR